MTSLNQLPFDTLKLDKSLIDYIENPRGKEVIRHTIALAHSLGMQVLAEGGGNGQSGKNSPGTGL